MGAVENGSRAERWEGRSGLRRWWGAWGRARPTAARCCRRMTKRCVEFGSKGALEAFCSLRATRLCREGRGGLNCRYLVNSKGRISHVSFTPVTFSRPFFIIFFFVRFAACIVSRTLPKAAQLAVDYVSTPATSSSSDLHRASLGRDLVRAHCNASYAVLPTSHSDWHVRDFRVSCSGLNCVALPFLC